MSVHLDAITLDDRIRQKLVRDLCSQRLGDTSFGRGKVELEVFALPDVGYAVISQRVQSVCNHLALRIEDGWLECDEDARAHAVMPSQGEKRDRRYGRRVSVARRGRTRARSQRRS